MPKMAQQIVYPLGVNLSSKKSTEDVGKDGAKQAIYCVLASISIEALAQEIGGAMLKFFQYHWKYTF